MTYDDHFYCLECNKHDASDCWCGEEFPVECEGHSQ